MKFHHFTSSFLILILLVSCSISNEPDETSSLPRVIAAESFLADITKNIAGDRLEVDTLIPPGVDPHSFQPTPADVAKINRSQVLVINGAGLEEFLDDLLENTSENAIIVEASTGLEPRTPDESEDLDHAIDPHFWLDPNHGIVYVENIRDGLISADPQGEGVYTE
ncbi:MAG: zinc ABC transporter substrate-binding protein, partial [Chloroflexi bacterium]